MGSQQTRQEAFHEASHQVQIGTQHIREWGKVGSALDFSRYSFPLKEDMYLRVRENFGHNGEFYAKIILIILIIGCLTDIPLLIILFVKFIIYKRWSVLFKRQELLDYIPGNDYLTNDKKMAILLLVNIYVLYVLGGDDIFTIVGFGYKILNIEYYNSCLIVLTHSVLSISPSTEPNHTQELNQNLIEQGKFSDLDQIKFADLDQIVIGSQQPTEYELIGRK